MKKFPILVLFLAVVHTLLYGQENQVVENKILRELFHVEKTYFAKKGNEKIEILSTRLRGRWASIPLNRCYLQQFDSDIAVLAFEIFLSDNPLDYKNLIDTLNHLEFNSNYYYIAKINPHKVKLIQLVYYNLANNEFIAKPDGFPIEQNFWMADSYGDVGSWNVQIKSLDKIMCSSLCCKLELSMGYDGFGGESCILKVVKLIDALNQADLVVSKDFKFGSSGGAIGCDSSSEFRNFQAQDFKIIAIKYTQCNCNEYGVNCEEHFGMKEGENNEIVTILNF